MKLRMDALHYALLAVLVLLVFYAASTYGLFKEGKQNNNLGRKIKALYQTCIKPCLTKCGDKYSTNPSKKLTKCVDGCFTMCDARLEK